MEIYIAICCDRHSDEVVRVFTTLEKAVAYCRAFVPEGYEIEEQELTFAMVREGWFFYATYGTEGDSVRVEKGQLDPPEEKWVTTAFN